MKATTDFQQPAVQSFKQESDAQTTASSHQNGQGYANAAIAVETPNNSIVDAFEFEPVGYMSKGRW